MPTGVYGKGVAAYDHTSAELPHITGSGRKAPFFGLLVKPEVPKRRIARKQKTWEGLEAAEEVDLQQSWSPFRMENEEGGP